MRQNVDVENKCVKTGVQFPSGPPIEINFLKEIRYV